MADEDERLADGVDDSAQVGGEPIEGDRAGRPGAIPEPRLVELDGLEPGRRQPGQDRIPDAAIIEKAVHEHEGPAAVAVTTEHDVSARDGCCAGHDPATLRRIFPPRSSRPMAAWMSSRSNTAAGGTNRAPLATRGAASRMTGSTFVA